MGRAWIIAASYAALVAIGFAAWNTERLYVGALAVLPLLFIGYHARLWIALATAIPSGIVLAALDRDIGVATGRIVLPPAVDAAVLTCALCGAVIAAEALRRASIQNETLRANLQRARRHAERDALTGVANRRYFLQRLRGAIVTAKDAQAGILFCDLDAFKAVNDTAGHPAGDVVLRLAAERLQHAVRTEDVVARIGGDEFAVLIAPLLPAFDADAIAAQIEREFAQPFSVGGRSFSVGITIGCSVAPRDGTSPARLLELADERMYRIKQAKRETLRST